MANSGRAPGHERRRDNQQWLLDWMVKTTGRTHNFAWDQRQLPAEIKSYRMIPRVLEKYGRHKETIAREAEAAGHRETAAELYFAACEEYRVAQHALFYDDHPEKIYLHGKLVECFEGIIRTSEFPIERVEIPWEGVQIQAYFYPLPDHRRAPTVVFCPGMDQTKEAYPEPTNNHFVKRGMNLLVLDGPGQGMSNIRKIRVTDDNYERAGKAAIDWLLTRPEVDPDRIGVSGVSMGSFWGHRLAAYDKRVKAVATGVACYGPKTAIFEEASPRFKQIFMYMAGIHDEDKFDAMAAKMTNDGKQVTSFSLQYVGEYDPLCHLEDAWAFFQEIAGPKEIWITENDFHGPWGNKNFGGLNVYGFLADWLNDALNDRLPRDLNRVRLVPDRSGKGPYEGPGRLPWLPARLQTGATVAANAPD